MKARALLFVLFLGATFYLGAQQNKVIDDFLASPRASMGKSAYLIMVGAGLSSEASSIAESFSLAQKDGFIPASATIDDPVNTETLALMAMRGFDIGGGVMYSIFHSRHYAFKELSIRGILDASMEAGRILTGDEAFRIISASASLSRRRK